MLISELATHKIKMENQGIQGPVTSSDTKLTVEGSKPALPDLILFIKKVIQYTRENNYEKLTKYLTCIRSCSSRRANRGIEVEVRKHGGLAAMSICLNRLVMESENNPDILVEHSKVIFLCLSLMANAFAVDHISRKEMISTEFVKNIKVLLQQQVDTSFNSELVYRSLRALGNLLFEVEIRSQTIRRGLIETIVKIIGRIHSQVKESIALQNGSVSTLEREQLKESASALSPRSDPVMTARKTLCDMEEAILISAVRCMRICGGDFESKHQLGRTLTLGKPELFVDRHLTRANNVLKIGEILTWPEVELLSEKLTFETLYALTVLTENFRTTTLEALTDIKRLGGPLLRSIIQIVGLSTNGTKVNLQAIRVLANLVLDKEIAELILPLGFYKVLFQSILETDDLTTLDKQISLFQRFVSNGKEICTYLLPYLRDTSDVNICSTVKVLRMPELEKYHMFLLECYEVLCESCLIELHKAGLSDVIESILSQIYGKSSFEDLSVAIKDIEVKAYTGACQIHDDPNGSKCSFALAEVQKEVFDKLECLRSDSPNEMCSAEQEASRVSPCTSPLSSSPGGFSFSSNDTFGESLYSPPTSGDECYSPLSLSEDEAVGLSRRYSADENDLPASLNKSPGKLSHSAPKSSAKPSSPKRARLSCADDATDLADDQKKENPVWTTIDKLPLIRKSVVAVRILHKFVFYKQLEGQLLHFLPYLMKFLLAGKISCIFYGQSRIPTQGTEELLILANRSFQKVQSILNRMFSNPQAFQKFLEDGAISLLHKIATVGNESIEDRESKASTCKAQIKHLMSVLSGRQNDTQSFRIAVLRENLRSEKHEDKQLKTAICSSLLAIDSAELRRSGCWNLLLSKLENFDSLTECQFHDLRLALSELFTTIGIRWAVKSEYLICPMLDFDTPAGTMNPRKKTVAGEETKPEGMVILELDDGSQFYEDKDFLVKASPVFSAMLDGHFVESEEQRVRFPNISSKALVAFMEQLKVYKFFGQVPSPQNLKYDLDSMFEVLGLCDRFLLPELYQKTHLTILWCYLCAHSAPLIYQKTLAMPTFNDYGSLVDERFTQLNILALKFILVGPGISSFQRTVSLRKVFNSIEPVVVVKDLKKLIDGFIEKK